MSGHLSTPEMAYPASIKRTSFLLPERPRLKEQLSLSEFTIDEDGDWKPDDDPSSSNQRPRRRNRFLKPFLPHPDNPTILQRTYGLIHGHSFDTNLTKAQVVGWRTGLKWATIGTASVFIANSLFLIATIVLHGINGGVGTLYSGDCNIVSNYDTWIHILINVLSTVLLGGSSYVMQCLNAPTREQVDRAHSQGKSLDIGMPSFKNARRVGWKQTGLWLFLAISAMPLHIFWNSAVFSTLEANQFDMFVAPEDFNATDNFSCDLVAGCDNAESLWQKSKAGHLQYLDNADCISAYTANFLGGRRNVLLVTSNATRGWKENTTQSDANANIFGIIMSRKFDQTLNGVNWTPNAWWCAEARDVVLNDSTSFQTNWYTQVWDENTFTCSPTLAASNAADLQVVVQTSQTRTNVAFELQYNGTDFINDIPSYLYDIDHCLSEKVVQVCQLQSAHYVWLIVIFCNAIKVGCMFLTAKVLRRAGEPLVVVGDAVASFLEKPDLYTEGNCLMSSRSSTKPKPEGGRAWRLKKPLWLRSSSKWSWIKTLVVCLGTITTLTTMLILIGTFSDDLGATGTSWNQLSLGGVSPFTLINIEFGNNPSSFGTLMSVLLFVNCPQIAFSCIYFMYNSLLTAMVAMQEFSRFSFRRRTLRVSTPVGAQRYTYWLQLPYTYSFPLLACSGLMHWFISQSLFLARIQVIDEYGAKMQSGVEVQSFPYSIPIEAGSLFTLPGYSPKAIVCALSLGAAMVIVIFGLSFRRHDGGVPFVANNSLAISASCHPPPGEADTHLRPLMWGAVSQPHGDTPGHCSFSGEAVEPPIIGQRYA